MEKKVSNSLLLVLALNLSVGFVILSELRELNSWNGRLQEKLYRIESQVDLIKDAVEGNPAVLNYYKEGAMKSSLKDISPEVIDLYFRRAKPFMEKYGEVNRRRIKHFFQMGDRSYNQALEAAKRNKAVKHEI